MSSDPSALYEGRRERFARGRGDAEARSRRLGRLRVAAFVGAFGAFLWAERADGPVWMLAVGLGAALVVAFAWLVRRHRRVRSRVRRLGALEELNREAGARLERRWQELPSTPPAQGLAGHPYAEDLDVVGPASLERLLSTVSTGPGARTMRSWLLEPAAPEEARARRAAVRELAPDTDFRQGLAARARLSGLERTDAPDSFLDWSDEGSWLADRPGLLWVGRVVPPATLTLLALQVAGVVSGAWWLGGVVAGLVFLGTGSQRIGGILDRISERQSEMGSYADVLAFLESMEPESSRLRAVREQVRAGQGSASDALRSLEWWVTVSDVRHNDLLHGPLQVLLFWDVHVLWGLERWRRREGRGVRSWLRGLGEAEALAALSALAADHPRWADPDFHDELKLTAGRLGHPLLSPEECVQNDVEVGPPGTFLLLTGSNMAGKSTLLRALGLNVVLARTGAPVCAETLECGRLRPVTSMRIEDSLSEGVSEFMAELRRVRLVVDEALRADGASAALYLLDEPLQGTNEAERREAVRIVLGRLLDSGGVGAVATHDLLLHRTERLEEAARPVHFTSRVEEADGELRLRFDYRLREGPATSTNALDLLRLVGLAEESRE